MARLVTVLIGQAHQRLLSFALWAGVFLLVIVGGALLGIAQIQEIMRHEGDRAIQKVSRSSEAARDALTEMQRRLIMEPCSPDFHAALRQIAYLGDGINVLLYLEDGKVLCSVDRNLSGADLGQPDYSDGGGQVFLDRDLGIFGIQDTGSILTAGNFGVVLPTPRLEFGNTVWLAQSYALVASGKAVHRTGDPEVTQAYEHALEHNSPTSFLGGVLYNTTCAPDGVRCVISRGQLYVAAANSLPLILLWVAVSAILAWAVSERLHALIRRFWSFEARFLRHFNADRVKCVYQPILSLETGRVVGCEVLARWRDVDDTTVFPDKFLPVVERKGLTRILTLLVVQRAFAELSTLTLRDPLQVSFNVEPADLDASFLHQALSQFEAASDRFRVVVEIVESDEVEIDRAQREIDLLRRYGIKTHLDDFGTGYSNIQNLATLALDGVKLDRSFAMAAKGSLMESMLFRTIEMIHTTGHPVTVEGVETESRLHDLRATGQVQYVQGYVISRPLGIHGFAQFLADAEPVSWRPRLVA